MGSLNLSLDIVLTVVRDSSYCLLNVYLSEMSHVDIVENVSTLYIL